MKKNKLFDNSKQNSKVKVSMNIQSAAQLDQSKCRVCLEAKGKISLFESLGAEEKFQYCTLLKVDKNDDLPTKLCKRCMDNMHIAYDFRSQAVYAEDYLRRTFLEPLTKEGSSVNSIVLKEEQNDAKELDESLKEIDLLIIPEDTVKVEDKAQDNLSDHSDYLGEAIIFSSSDTASTQELEKNSYEFLIERCDQMEWKEEQTEAFKLNGKDGLQDVPIVVEPKVEPSDVSMNDDSSSDDFAFDAKDSKPVAMKNGTSVTIAASNVPTQSAPKEPKLSYDGRVVKTVECIICGIKLRHVQSLKQHLLSHTGVKPFRCEICRKTFGRRNALNEHRRIHTGEKPYKCDECIRQFMTKLTMMRHKKHVHESRQADIQCDVCEKCFRTQTALSSHMKVQHSETGNASTLQFETSNYCEECNEEFPKSADFRIHQKEHEMKKFLKCGACQMAFVKKYQLLEHMQVHENPDDLLEEFVNKTKDTLKYFSDSSAKTYSEFNQWKKKYHSIRCLRCKMTFTNYLQYRTHIQHFCTDATHRCSRCYEIFHRKTLLQLHMKRHMDQLTYSCPVCSKTEATKVEMLVHMKTQHIFGENGKGSRAATLQCNICHWSCKAIETYMKHLSLHD